MEEEAAKVEVEAQSQKVDDTTYLISAAYNRTKQALSLDANREESEKMCILKGLQRLLDIQNDETEFKDLRPIDFMSYHDASREAYKTVARAMAKKMGSIAIQKFQLLMHFTGQIGISIEDAISILDETKDEVSQSKGVMQDLTELDRENDNAELDPEDDNTKLDQEDDNIELDIEISGFVRSNFVRRRRINSVMATLNLEAPEWIDCVEHNVPSWISALLFRSSLKNELRQICPLHGKTQSSFLCQECISAVCQRCLSEGHQNHRHIRVYKVNGRLSIKKCAIFDFDCSDILFVTHKMETIYLFPSGGKVGRGPDSCKFCWKIMKSCGKREDFCSLRCKVACWTKSFEKDHDLYFGLDSHAETGRRRSR